MSNFYRVGVKADKKNSLPEKVIIPTRQGKVIAIADEGFQNCKTIKEIVLPEKTQFMGDNAFSGCAGLTEIIIPANVQNMGANVFNGCGSEENPLKIIVKRPYDQLNNWNANWLGTSKTNVDYQVLGTLKAPVLLLDSQESPTALTIKNENNIKVSYKVTGTHSQESQINAGDEAVIQLGANVTEINVTVTFSADHYNNITKKCVWSKEEPDTPVEPDITPEVYYIGTDGSKYKADTVNDKIYIFTGLKGITESTNSVTFTASQEIASCLVSALKGANYQTMAGSKWNADYTSVTLNSTTADWSNLYVKVTLA